MASTTVRLDTTKARAALAYLKAQAPQRLARALNRSRDSARTAMVRLVASDMKLLQKDIRSEIRTKNATSQRLVADMSASLKRLPLIKFKATQFSKGVKATTGEGRKLYPGTFIAKMPSGHQGVFKRRSKARLPIDELRGPSIGHVFNKHAPAAASRATEQLRKNTANEVRYLLRQAQR